jgi:hypothetical protein
MTATSAQGRRSASSARFGSTFRPRGPSKNSPRAPRKIDAATRRTEVNAKLAVGRDNGRRREPQHPSPLSPAAARAPEFCVICFFFSLFVSSPQPPQPPQPKTLCRSGFCC